MLDKARTYFHFSNEPKKLQRDMNTYAKAREMVEDMDSRLEKDKNAWRKEGRQGAYMQALAICHFFESSPEYAQYSAHRNANSERESQASPSEH